MPGGEEFALWEDETDYQKIYYVNQNHPDASDSNEGSAGRPFASIGRAAEVLQAGEKVIISSGTYREFVQPARGGKSNAEMISYEAETGASVVISGAAVFREEWVTSLSPAGQPFSHKLWMAPLKEDYFPGSNPFSIQNASEEDIDLMPWAEDWKGHFPYTLGRGMIFQDGRRLVQMAEYTDMIRLPGSYWIGPEAKFIHIQPYNEADPNEAEMEISVHQQLFSPEKSGSSFIHLKGLEFEKAGNGFPRVGTGAVFVNGGSHWIIEDCKVSQCNSVGIEAGARVKERAVSTREENAAADTHKGGFIIRNNEVFECGTGGIQGHNVFHSLIQNNHIHHIGWQNVERYWECAAIKILVVQNSLATGNVIHDVEGASAIWFDWDIRNSRISGNIIYDIAPNYNGAVFIEASQVPNSIDNNFFWNIGSFGVALYDTDLCRVANNFFGKSQVPISSRVNTHRTLNGRLLTSKDNQMVNNIFYHVERPSIVQSAENTHDYNLIIPEKSDMPSSEKWDKHSKTLDAGFVFDRSKLELEVRASEEFPVFQNELVVETDIFGHPRRKSFAGPFRALYKGETRYKLKQTSHE